MDGLTCWLHINSRHLSLWAIWRFVSKSTCFEWTCFPEYYLPVWSGSLSHQLFITLSRDKGLKNSHVKQKQGPTSKKDGSEKITDHMLLKSQCLHFCGLDSGFELYLIFQVIDSPAFWAWDEVVSFRPLAKSTEWPIYGKQLLRHV